MLPEQSALTVPFTLTAYQRQQTASLGGERLNGVSVVSGRIFGASQRDACRHDVDEVARLVHDGAFSALHACGPVHNCGRGDASVERLRLPVTERRVDGSRPSSAEIVVGQLVARRPRVVRHHLSVARAVVSVELAYAVIL